MDAVFLDHTPEQIIEIVQSRQQIARDFHGNPGKKWRELHAAAIFSLAAYHGRTVTIASLTEDPPDVRITVDGCEALWELVDAPEIGDKPKERHVRLEQQDNEKPTLKYSEPESKKARPFPIGTILDKMLSQAERALVEKLNKYEKKFPEGNLSFGLLIRSIIDFSNAPQYMSAPIEWEQGFTRKKAWPSPDVKSRAECIPDICIVTPTVPHVHVPSVIWIRKEKSWCSPPIVDPNLDRRSHWRVPR